MKWLKKLLGMEPVAASTAPVDAGAKAFDNMAKTLTEPKEVKEVVPEVVAPADQYGSTAIPLAEVPAEIVLAKPKAPRKPRAKKEEAWPFPGDVPAEGKSKPAAKKAKAK
jgi:hypothetical protein